MERDGTKIYGRACVKTAAQQWVGYIMPNNQYHLCTPDTLKLKIGYLTILNNGIPSVYDGYFATCLTNNSLMVEVLVSVRLQGQPFEGQNGHLVQRPDGHIISSTAFIGAEALRLRVDTFRVDWSKDKASNNYAWTALTW